MNAQPNWFSLRNYALIAVYLSPPDTPSPPRSVVHDDVRHHLAAPPNTNPVNFDALVDDPLGPTPSRIDPSSLPSTARVGASEPNANEAGHRAVASIPSDVVDDVFGLGHVANSSLTLTTFVNAGVVEGDLLGLGESSVYNADSTPAVVADAGVAFASPSIASAEPSAASDGAPAAGGSSADLRELAACAHIRLDTFLDLFSVQGDATGDAPLRLAEVVSLPPVASVASG